MPFPSTLSSLTNPNPTDRLNAPSHSSIESAQNDAIEQLERVIGVEGASSVVGSLEYLIKSPDSNGGGHVQTANKGGTGQTSYTKGDVLVATSSSVLSKLAVGADGTFLKANASVAAGVEWNAGPGKISASVMNSSSIIGQGIATESSVFSITIPGSVLGANNAVRATFKAILAINPGPASSMIARMTYGGGRAASVIVAGVENGSSGNPLRGGIECLILGNGTTTAQTTIINPFFGRGIQNSVIGATTSLDFATTSVASDGNQTLGLTWQFCEASGGNQLTPIAVIVEKIT